MFVVDASAAVKWFFKDEESAAADGVLERLQSGERAFVPQIFPWEMLNALLYAERRGRIESAEVDQAVCDLNDMPLEIEPDAAYTKTNELDLSRAYELSIYDASYLACASRRGAEMITGDVRLEAAARELGLQTTLL